MDILLRYVILLLIYLFEYHQGFEILTSHDKIWSYMNVTCKKLPKKDVREFKNEEMINLFYDIKNAHITRAVRETEHLSNLPKKTETYKNDISNVHYGERSIKERYDINENVELQANIIKSAERVLLYTNCNSVILKSSVVANDVNSLFINSDASVTLKEGWFGTNVTILKIYAKNLCLPNNCSWLPPNIKQLDIVGASLSHVDLSLCEFEIKILSLVETNLSRTKFCFKMLENLDISSNNVETLELTCANNIRELKASHNNLLEWSWCNLPNLVSLSIDHNHIRNINFSKCNNDKLFSLDASHNQLDHFPNNLPEELSILVLSYNKIENITVIENSFKVLDLSHNIIHHLVKGAFRLAWELSELNLSHNLLFIIHGHDFSGLRQLSVLDLSHNKIQHIRQKAFSSLVNLKKLHINGNNLHKLDTRLLVYLPKKVNFLAHGNPWSCSCYLLAELSKIIRSKCLPKCHQQNKLKCKQGKVWIPAATILQKCLRAVQSNFDADFIYPSTPDSDEDTSEEKEKVSVVALNSGLILVLLLIVCALSVKMYTGRKWVKRHFCNCSKPSSGQAVKNKNGLTSIGSMPESESETEL